MKTFSLILLIAVFFISCSNSDSNRENTNKTEIRNGDIIFQTSKSSQSKAIQIATKSKYSHMGIIYKEGDNYFVYEAIQPVKLTPFKSWIARGENQHYVIKRLKNANSVLTPESLKKMKAIGEL